MGSQLPGQFRRKLSAKPSLVMFETKAVWGAAHDRSSASEAKEKIACHEHDVRSRSSLSNMVCVSGSGKVNHFPGSFAESTKAMATWSRMRRSFGSSRSYDVGL